jgi:hypothetical protein
MASSDTDICNSALSKVGARRIISLTDDLEEARICSDLYPVRRDMLLRSHPWRFAVTRVELAPVVDVPLFDFSNAFQLPPDCLRVLNTNQPYNSRWKEENGLILCFTPTLMIQYIYRNTDVSKWDANFCEVLSYDLAKEICFPLTQNASLKQDLEATAKQELAVARSYNAQIGSVESVEDDSWVLVRH